MGNRIYKAVADLNRNKTSQHGGLCRVRYIPVEDVVSIPLPAAASAVVETAITLVAGKSWFTAFGPLRRGVQSSSKAGDSGSFVESTTTAVLPFISRSGHLALDRMKYHRFIVLADRANGDTLILGTLDNPASFEFVSDSGQSIRDSANVEIRFIWISEDLPLIYSV